MHDSAIRHLSGCDDSFLVAAAFFDSVVQVWNCENGEKVGEFETVLDFGGRRLALTNAGNICVAASWQGGLAGYSVPRGILLWHRSEFVEIQNISCSRSEGVIFCGFEGGTTAIVSAASGDQVGLISNAQRVICASSSRTKLLEQQQNYHIQDSCSLDIPALSFTLLDAAFSEDQVCLSEPNEGVRCIELRSGRTLWHHRVFRSNYLTFCVEDNNFYCISGSNRPPHDCSLIRLAPSLMDCDQAAYLGPCWAATFIRLGALLVTMRGDVYETATGKIVRQLNFPQREYPDVVRLP
jgi:hypothetical protein